MKRKFLLLTLFTAILPLSACSALSPTRDPLAGTSWKLASLAGKPAVSGTNVTIQFEDGRAGGTAGCNSYGGAYAVDGEKIRFQDIVSTLMACADPATMDQESAYLQFLGEAARFALTDGQLQLFRADGQALAFVPVQ